MPWLLISLRRVAGLTDRGVGQLILTYFAHAGSGCVLTGSRRTLLTPYIAAMIRRNLPCRALIVNPPYLTMALSGAK